MRENIWSNLRSLKSFLVRSLNRKRDTIKIFSVSRKTENCNTLQQTTALRFLSSILAVTGKSDIQFFGYCNINRALEPNIPGS